MYGKEPFSRIPLYHYHVISSFKMTIPLPFFLLITPPNDMAEGGGLVPVTVNVLNDMVEGCLLQVCLVMTTSVCLYVYKFHNGEG